MKGIYQDFDEGFGDFAPKGDSPENLNSNGGQKPQTESEADAALAEFAPISKAGKTSSLAVDAQKITVPNDDIASIYNRKV